MDGNRRYAREHNFENVIMGYTLGARQLMQIFPWCFGIGIKSLTVWAMSSDNFRRDPAEVQGLIDQMTLFFEDFLLLDASVPVMGVRVRITGDTSILPQRLLDAISKVEEKTCNNKSFNFQIAINYGGREEIVMAVKQSVHQLAKQGDSYLIVDKLTPSLISNQTYASRFGLDEVDAILRTSGEIRLSGFHLWESNNAELVFVSLKWPELDELTFLKAAVELSTRQKRHGL
jgi:short-chain Z-isoprenyl diphosphate synthase